MPNFFSPSSKFSSKRFINAVTRDISRRATVRYRPRIERGFESAKILMISSIKNNPISVDFKNHGPIFGYFGFEEGDDPVGDLITYLNETVQYSFTGFDGRRKKGRVRVRLPSKRDLRAFSSGLFSLPWKSGVTWVEAIEDGNFNNLEYFWQKKKYGRSKEGFQNTVPSKKTTSFSPRPYLSEAIAEFRKEFVRHVR